MIAEKCSAMRCFLSDLLFEKMFGWQNAGEVARRIKNSVAEHNQNRIGMHCRGCDNTDLVRDISGSDGLFTSAHEFYRCRKCGNAQNDDGDTYQYEDKKLEGARIIDDRGRYRYIFLRPGGWYLIFCLSVFWAVFGSATLIVPGGFSYLQGFGIGLAPLILFFLVGSSWVFRK